jgi:hypothetical protein
MERIVSENHLSSSLQTTLAVGGAFALVAGAVIHHNKDRLTSLLIENIASEEMNQNTDWQKLTIPAQVCILLILIINK